MKQLVLRVMMQLYRWLGAREPGRATLQHRVEMAYWRQFDVLRWRLERATEMGIRLGRNVALFSLNVFSEPSLVEIGNNTIVSGDVHFVTHDGGVALARDRWPNLTGHFGRIVIGNDCFIGMRATIMPNVRLGDRCIVAAGSVVFESFPANSVIMGNPAKFVFPTDMYLSMKQASPHTIYDPAQPFPAMSLSHEWLAANVPPLPATANAPTVRRPRMAQQPAMEPAVGSRGDPPDNA